MLKAEPGWVRTGQVFCCTGSFFYVFRNKQIRKLQFWAQIKSFPPFCVQIWVNSPHCASGYYTIYGEESLQADHFNTKLSFGDPQTFWARTGYLGFIKRTELLDASGGQTMFVKNRTENEWKSSPSLNKDKNLKNQNHFKSSRVSGSFKGKLLKMRKD